MAILIVMMMTATIVEKTNGSSVAFDFFYHSPLFIGLWALAAVTGIIWLFKSGVHRKPVVMLIHLSFLLILAGAFTTHFWGRQGVLHLREGESASTFLTREGRVCHMPFSIRLESFEIAFYPGTDTPMDFISNVSAEGVEASISMNKILKNRGYRFYQSGYDPDGHGTVLAVNHDPYGTGLSYAGYFLLFISLFLFFFVKDTHFRRVLRRSMTTLSAICVLMAAGELCADAARTPKTAPEEITGELSNLFVYYNGRITTVETLARDYTLKVYGKTRAAGMDANSILAGWIWYADTWEDVPVKVKKKDMGTMRESEKYYAIQAVASLRAMRIFPCKDGDGVLTWYSPSDETPSDMDASERLFIRGVFGLLEEDLFNGNTENALATLRKIKEYQIRNAGDVLPSKTALAAEHAYYMLDRTKAASMALMSFGLILFVAYVLAVANGRSLSRKMQIPGFVVALAVLLWLTALLEFRWFASGHLPMTSGFEMMMLIAWMSSLFTVALWKKMTIILPLGTLLTGFALLVASMGESNPQITPLMPVLGSPLLSIHVATMMISYTLFGIAALNGVMGVTLRKKIDVAQSIADTGLLIIYPGLFLLSAGTFLGAIWANVSWGNYWAWDPKETWALVTMLVYAMGIHGTSLKWMRKPLVFNWFCIVAFMSVLITYFGVNFILGGMHSYA